MKYQLSLFSDLLDRVEVEEPTQNLRTVQDDARHLTGEILDSAPRHEAIHEERRGVSPIFLPKAGDDLQMGSHCKQSERVMLRGIADSFLS